MWKRFLDKGDVIHILGQVSLERGRLINHVFCIMSIEIVISLYNYVCPFVFCRYNANCCAISFHKLVWYMWQFYVSAGLYQKTQNISTMLVQRRRQMVYKWFVIAGNLIVNSLMCCVCWNIILRRQQKRVAERLWHCELRYKYSNVQATFKKNQRVRAAWQGLFVLVIEYIYSLLIKYVHVRKALKYWLRITFGPLFVWSGELYISSLRSDQLTIFPLSIKWIISESVRDLFIWNIICWRNYHTN